MKATIHYDSLPELEVDDFAEWAEESFSVLDSFDLEDLDNVAARLVIETDGIVSIELEGGEDHYRDGWDSSSTDEDADDYDWRADV